jgi:hypothetical protein
VRYHHTGFGLPRERDGGGCVPLVDKDKEDALSKAKRDPSRGPLSLVERKEQGVGVGRA